MHYLIYKITNRLNNKFYVGKHKTEDKDDGYFGSGLLLERAVKKHGKENFVKEILFELPTEDEMNQKEADIVDEDFVARDDTYNIKLGGIGGWDHIDSSSSGKLGQKTFRDKFNSDAEFRNEVTQKWSIQRTKWLEKFGTTKTFFGKTHSDASKRQISHSMKGKNIGSKNGVYGTRWITNGTENRMSKSIPDGWKLGRTILPPKL